jgi:hypothetical protein
VLYHWSHAPVLFIAVVSFQRKSPVLFPRTGLRQQSSNLYLPSSWDFRSAPPCPACLLTWDLTNFLPGLVWNHAPPDCLPSTWDCRCARLHYQDLNPGFPDPDCPRDPGDRNFWSRKMSYMSRRMIKTVTLILLILTTIIYALDLNSGPCTC